MEVGSPPPVLVERVSEQGYDVGDQSRLGGGVSRKDWGQGIGVGELVSKRR